MTREAFLRSRLNPGLDNLPQFPGSPKLLMELGVLDAYPSLGSWYMAVSASAFLREALPGNNPAFGRDKLRDANRESSFKPVLGTLPAWLMLGAVREDDVPFDAGARENNPQDDPEGPFARVFNHFHDPVYDEPLTVGLDLGARAFDWALEARPFRQRQLPHYSAFDRTNRYSIPAAREAMWRALTLKQWPPSGGALPDLPFVASPELGTRAELRRAYWATAFHALGGSLHLLQDMAQPQHTRGDPHSGLGCARDYCAGGHASYYEHLVDANVSGARRFTLRERFAQSGDPRDIVEPVAASPVSFGSYPIPAFPAYRDYFFSATGTQSVAGTGLANYSNQGFYSAGTNLGGGASRFPSPNPAYPELEVEDLPEGAVVNASGASVGDVRLKLLRATVRDSWRPELTQARVRLSSFGLFDQFLRSFANHEQFTLNHYNYRDQMDLLVPRAVAYSAGVINHFFRGELQIAVPDEGVFAAVDHTEQSCKDTCGFGRVRLKLRNATPNNEAMSGGVFVAVVKFRRNLDYRPDLSGQPGAPNFTGSAARSLSEEIVVSAPAALTALAPGQQLPTAFDFPQRIPVNATDLQLQVVYRGRLGQETDAVVVTTLDIAEPSFYAVTNSTDYYYDATADAFHRVPYGNFVAPDPITDLALSFNGATPVATIPVLDGGRTAQLAFLGPRGTQPTLLSWSHGPRPQGGWNLPAFEFGAAGGSGPYQGNINAVASRGLYHVVHQFHIYPPSYDSIAPPCGQEPALCRQETLTPPVKVAWHVTF